MHGYFLNMTFHRYAKGVRTNTSVGFKLVNRIAYFTAGRKRVVALEQRANCRINYYKPAWKTRANLVVANRQQLTMFVHIGGSPNRAVF